MKVQQRRIKQARYSLGITFLFLWSALFFIFRQLGILQLNMLFHHFRERDVQSISKPNIAGFLSVGYLVSKYQVYLLAKQAWQLPIRYFWTSQLAKNKLAKYKGIAFILRLKTKVCVHQFSFFTKLQPLNNYEIFFISFMKSPFRSQDI